ncbi:zona pellucida sperm-binding protein 3-like [Amia ocellicauda]|uniref:zona pellucida sperm-binding protein 3-like n=1 Tax=Amia ocellicauda TaxID=2972642 RepID=UPI0034640E3F
MKLICIALCLCVGVLFPTPVFADSDNETSKESSDIKTLSKHYRILPMFIQASAPLVDPKKLRPATGSKPMPDDLRRILFPGDNLRKGVHPKKVQNRGVAVWGDYSKMYVAVHKNINGFRCRPSELMLGSCAVSKTTEHYYYFIYGLNECGNKRSIINGRLVYSNTLRYSPPTSSHPVIRGVSFTVPIQLVYNRFHYSYKIGYQPTFPQHGSTLPGMDKSAFFRELKNRHGYILVTTNEQWIRLSPKNIYYLGQPMYFQATGYFATEGQRLFIQSCYATASPDRHSKPRFTVIDNFGCLVDSKADGCQSRFVPYTRKDVLRFTIDAFLFQKTLSEHVMTELYMHCTMTVAEHVTPGTKSCTYNRKAKRWEELYGNHAVCTCCDSRCAGDRAEGQRSGLVTSHLLPLEHPGAKMDSAEGAHWSGEDVVPGLGSHAEGEARQVDSRPEESAAVDGPPAVEVDAWDDSEERTVASEDYAAELFKGEESSWVSFQDEDEDERGEFHREETDEEDERFPV